MKIDKSTERRLKAFEQLNDQFGDDVKAASASRLEQAKKDLLAGKISAARFEQIRDDVMKSLSGAGRTPPT